MNSTPDCVWSQKVVIFHQVKWRTFENTAKLLTEKQTFTTDGNCDWFKQALARRIKITQISGFMVSEINCSILDCNVDIWYFCHYSKFKVYFPSICLFKDQLEALKLGIVPSGPDQDWIQDITYQFVCHSWKQ